MARVLLVLFSPTLVVFIRSSIYIDTILAFVSLALHSVRFVPFLRLSLVIFWHLPVHPISRLGLFLDLSSEPDHAPRSLRPHLTLPSWP